MDKGESSAAKAIRDGWRIVLKKNDGLKAKIKEAIAIDEDSFDGELDQAWFESHNGTLEMVSGVRLFSFEESQKWCAQLVKDPSRAPDVTNRKIYSRPIGQTENGDLIALATIGRGNIYGKILQITQEQMADTEPSYDPMSVVVESAGKWIKTIFK